MKNLFFTLTFLICSFTSSNAQTEGLDVGDIIPDIDLPDAKGNVISLSSLRGSLVLVDLWASWCGPCVKEQPELLKLYQKYPNKFMIYGVSLDSKKPAWLGAMAKLKQPWTQVSDLKLWDSPVVINYKIQSIPFNALIDKNGIILAKNIHGNKLEELIKALTADK
ncbi:TlpA family protein disulfide reductase [Flavobacterium sp. LS1R47]|jgi:thiol-disulfide isomerase/thioredoxin|uniref:TlpA family protein disulfide reductase n=1 Tax=Flavobacterium frigoritolerans TaxID=2987686 RepID=A0A9X3HMF7_9FLAO|nr:TlpA disulfide reductase family protein [Flavobacterium frigoritolerans]MCV9934072.1 TlpA family protein disulfide reductase [Flavobacterium frigoritolerans]